MASYQELYRSRLEEDDPETRKWVEIGIADTTTATNFPAIGDSGQFDSGTGVLQAKCVRRRIERNWHGSIMRVQAYYTGFEGYS